MITLMQGDCLERMKEIPDESVDLVLTDPPFGTTACKWDSVIPLEPMWKELKRITKPNSAIVLFGSQPFTSILVASNLSMFKYQWLWRKTRPSNFFAAKFMPLNAHEDICVFSTGGCNNGSKNPMIYYPQGTVEIDRFAINNNTGGKVGAEHKSSIKTGSVYNQKTTGYPDRELVFKNDLNTVHPTQKPVSLMEYLIKTYTNESETVLDFTFGSGTTGVACVNTNRKFIGIEQDEGYFKIAQDRIQAAQDALLQA